MTLKWTIIWILAVLVAGIVGGLCIQVVEG